MNLSIRTIKTNVLAALFLLVTTVAAFFPNIITDSGLYGTVRILAFGSLLILTILCTSFRSLKNNYIQSIAVQILLITVMLFFFSSIGFHTSRTDIVILVITLWAICIGYSINVNTLDVEFLLLMYGGLTVLLGLVTMFFFVGSVALTDYMYVIDTKNMVGQVVSTGGIGLMIITLASKKNRLIKIGLVAISTVLVFVLRCRTALAAYLVFFVLLVWRKLTRKQFLFFVLLALVGVAIFHTQLFALFEDVFIGSTDISDLDSVSAGRMERNIAGLQFFRKYPVFGEMRTASDLANIHNYVIKRLAAYGLFSLPFLVLYFYMLVTIVKQCWKADFDDVWDAGALMMIIPFFASLLEPISPFGPGLVQVIPFFFYGIYLKKYTALKHLRFQSLNK